MAQQHTGIAPSPMMAKLGQRAQSCRCTTLLKNGISSHPRPHRGPPVLIESQVSNLKVSRPTLGPKKEATKERSSKLPGLLTWQSEFLGPDVPCGRHQHEAVGTRMHGAHNAAAMRRSSCLGRASPLGESSDALHLFLWALCSCHARHPTSAALPSPSTVGPGQPASSP